MAGFFDGILLHQVLQWHHLLSLIPNEAVQDPRVQIVADGVFHLLMYLLLGIGLVGLWRRRARVAALPVSAVVGTFLLGFGLWQVVDILGFHWLLRFHHVRVDAPAPVAWDIGWLLLLGLPPLLIGRRLSRRRAAHDRRGGALPPVLLVFATALAGVQALKPTESANAVVLFAPGTDSAVVMEGLAAADARLVEISAEGDLAIVAFERPGRAWRLYGYGALLVGGAGPAGCAAAIATPLRG